MKTCQMPGHKVHWDSSNGSKPTNSVLESQPYFGQGITDYAGNKKQYNANTG